MAESPTKLGSLLDPDSEHIRDAVHVAVYPAIAAEPLRPGEHIGLDASGWASSHVTKLIGIVDPFLPEGTVVDSGEHFWLCLYPGSITSLRHLWEHPEFEAGATTTEWLTTEDLKLAEAKKASEKWLRNFAMNYDVDYDELVREAAKGGEDADLYFPNTSGPEKARTNEFWRHVENVTGKYFSDDHRQATYFRCSC